MNDIRELIPLLIATGHYRWAVILILAVVVAALHFKLDLHLSLGH